jgi:hypothetical protein
MRVVLATQVVEILTVVPQDFFNQIVDMSPGAKLALGGCGVPSESDRYEMMLTVLETESRWFRLLSIEMVAFVLDEHPQVRQRHPPLVATERGTVWLVVVLHQTHCVSLESLDLTYTSIK